MQKAAWKIINKRRKFKKSNFTDTTITPNQFNDYFTNITKTLIDKLPISDVLPQSFLPKQTHTPIFSFSHISEIEVRNIITLKNSFQDVYDLSTRILKSAKDTIISPFTKIINACITQNSFPNKLKQAKVTPIFKKGDTNDLNNFRPISILPTFSKFFERVLYNQIMKHLTINNLLTDR